MKKKETIEEKEKRDAEAYTRMPQQASEIEEWQPEQEWDEDEEGDPKEGIQQTAAIDEGTKVMKEAFEETAEICNQLEGRDHSDSTEIVRKDRATMSCDVEAPVDAFSDDDHFLLKACEPSLDTIWDNSADDIYEELLNR